MQQQDRLLGEGSYGKVYGHWDGTAIKVSTIHEMDDLVPAAREVFLLRKGIPGCVPYVSSRCYAKRDSNEMHIQMMKAASSLRVATVDPKAVAISLLHTLYKLHQLGIMHRDLKLSNVLVKGDKVWVCDFGMSRQFCSDKGEGLTGYMFTKWYRAPEVFREEGYTSKADMWSLGCIVHSLIYGKVPGENLPEILQRIPKLEGKEGEMGTLVRNLLRLDPSKRWSAKQALAFLKQPCVPFADKFAVDAGVRSKNRTKWFNLFRDRFEGEHRVLAHALMLFDKGRQLKNRMCAAMAVSAMLFKADAYPIVFFAEDHFRGDDFEEFLGKFIASVCDGELSGWERTKRTKRQRAAQFRDYLQNMLY